MDRYHISRGQIGGFEVGEGEGGHRKCGHEGRSRESARCPHLVRYIGRICCCAIYRRATIGEFWRKEGEPQRGSSALEPLNFSSTPFFPPLLFLQIYIRCSSGRSGRVWSGRAEKLRMMYGLNFNPTRLFFIFLIFILLFFYFFF